MIFLLSVLIILSFLVSTFGWGSQIVKLSYGDTNCHWSFMSALGLATWIFLGGLLNMLRLAYWGSLCFLFCAGIGLTFLHFRRSRNYIVHTLDSSRTIADRSLYLLSLIVIFSTVSFSIATLMPSNMFNYSDDFQLYLVRPFYMLQTGTLSGNPFEILGIESLGAQSFLQAFIVALFHPEYVNGFDIVFCFILTAFLLVGIADTLKVHGFYLMMSVLALILINPQVVNISPVYSGSTMVLGTIFASILLTNFLVNHETKSVFRALIPFALFLSALVSLKFTFVITAGLYSILFLLFLSSYMNKKKVFISISYCIILVLIFLLPWFVCYWEKYWLIIQHMLYGKIQGTLDSNGINSFKYMINKLFSPDNLFYGGSLLGYSFIMLILLILSVLSAYSLIVYKSTFFKANLIPVFAASLAGIVNFFANHYFFDINTSVRYSCPVFIAVLPLAFLLLGKNLLFHSNSQDSKTKITLTVFGLRSVLVVLLVILIGCFWDVTKERINRGYHKRTAISFPIEDPNYLQYNKSALSKEVRDLVRSIQDKTDNGQTILAGISIPFHFDFSRNTIYYVHELGLFNPGLDIPNTGNPEDIRKSLKDKGIRYIIVADKGTWMKGFQKVDKDFISLYPVYKKIAENALYFRKMLIQLATMSNILYTEKGITLVDISQYAKFDPGQN
jgi:hypothetical protein